MQWAQSIIITMTISSFKMAKTKFWNNLILLGISKCGNLVTNASIDNCPYLAQCCTSDRDEYQVSYIRVTYFPWLYMYISANTRHVHSDVPYRMNCQCLAESDNSNLSLR